MKYKVQFNDEIEANSPEEAYDMILEYLKDCVKFGDVTGFSFIDENGEEK
jgi:hypothetical protein